MFSPWYELDQRGLPKRACPAYDAYSTPVVVSVGGTLPWDARNVDWEAKAHHRAPTGLVPIWPHCRKRSKSQTERLMLEQVTSWPIGQSQEAMVALALRELVFCNLADSR